METILRDLEYFATLASLQDAKYSYPKYVDYLCIRIRGRDV